VVQSIQAPFKPESENTLSGLYRHVATGQNGSVIIGRDSTLKSMIAVQRFGATSILLVLQVLVLSEAIEQQAVWERV